MVLKLAIASAMLGVSAAMIIYEQVRLRSGPFLVTEGGRISYWSAYLFLLALGVALLISAAVG